MVANHNMGVQVKLLCLLPIQASFLLFGPAHLLVLLISQCHSFDVEELPLGLSRSVLHTSGWL